MTPKNNHTIKIISFKDSNYDAENLDFYAQIKNSFLGKLYHNYIKKTPLRKYCQYLLRYYLKLNQIIKTSPLNKNQSKKLKLISLFDYLKINNLSKLVLFEKSSINLIQPLIAYPKHKSYLPNFKSDGEFPPIYIGKLTDITVYGSTNILFTDEYAICHDLYNFDVDYTSEELHNRHYVNIKKKYLSILNSDNNPNFIPVAAPFLDSCSSNFAHWLTEILPRISIFCSKNEYSHIPIIIDEDLHPNLIESLELIVGNNRKIYSLPKGKGLKIGISYTTSVTGYTPFGPRRKNTQANSHGAFSPIAFNYLSNQLLSITENYKYSYFPKKIYLKRYIGPRKIINSETLEDILLKKGFEIIELEKLSFKEQISILRNADEIIGPSGAAFANIIFVKPSAKIHILWGDYPLTPYGYWQNIASCRKIQLTYSFCKSVNTYLGIHSDILIPPQLLSYLDKNH